MVIGESDTTDTSASIEFVFSDELSIKMVGDFVIDDDLLNKIKNLIKKIHYLYLQIWYKGKDKRFAESYREIMIDSNGWGLAYMKTGYRP